MKVLFVTSHLNIGGITKYIFILGKALRARGVDSVVVSAGGDAEQEFVKNGIEVATVDFRTKSEVSPKVFRGALELARIARRKEIDIIHAHTRVTQVASALAARRVHVPYVSTCHGFFKRRLGRMLFGCWGAKAIAISEPVRESLMNDFGLPPSRIELIHTGIDIDMFSKGSSSPEPSDLRRRLGLKECPIVGTIGRLSPVKGHRFFIEAVRGVVSRGRAVQGIIIGDGPEESELKTFARTIGMDDTFRFLKSDFNTAAYLALMDIFVFPSLEEGLGLSLVEAMASGKPCIASDVGGISDVVRDGETGLLVPAGDPGRMSEAIVRLLDDASFGRRLGESAKTFVRDRFSSAAMAEKVAHLYEEVVEAYEAHR